MSYLNYGNRELIDKARTLRKSMTRAEIILWSKLRSKRIMGLKFRRQQPILNYIVDFYCDSLKLIIEVDGEIHTLPAYVKYDIVRENNLKEHGFKLLRFMNYEVEFEMNSVLEKLHLYLRKNFPDQCSESAKLNEK
ncbi:MAG TPA: endonuclease domain-containing protein [Bacteroidales bacterium]|nr:endonuclease domain-containing protein [Bacteroidales bacterium]